MHNPSPKFLRLLIAVPLMACASTGPGYEVDVDAITRDDSVSVTRYLLAPGEAGLAAEDLQFIEYATLVERALAQRGFERVHDASEAEFGVLLRYGIGDPQRLISTQTVPVFGQTGISSSNTQGRVSVYGNTANYSETTNYTPTYGVIGSETRFRTDVTYVASAFLDAYDLRVRNVDGQYAPIWKTSICTVAPATESQSYDFQSRLKGALGHLGGDGSQAHASSGGRERHLAPDLRVLMPTMIAAAMPYLARNPGRRVTVLVEPDDPALLSLLEPANAGANASAR